MAVTMYHSTTAPNVGWWVLSDPTDAPGFRIVRVFKDAPATASDDEVVAAAREAFPSIGGWAVVTDTPKRHFIGRKGR